MPNTLEQVKRYLKDQSYNSEIIVVENASQDNTWQVAKEFADLHNCEQLPITVLEEPQKGKGAAVKKGMLAAKGEFRFMCDADLSMPIEEIHRFIPPSLESFDIAIASREAPGAIRYNEPAYRHVVGRIFNSLIRVLAIPDLNDTQCGFKCFKAEIAEELFPRMTIIGWSFDVEILYLARRLNYQIVEIPIPWYFNPHSQISVVGDSFQMAIDIFKIRMEKRNSRHE